MNEAASDPAMTADILLVLSIVLDDGETGVEGRVAFRRVCREFFGVEAEEIEKAVPWPAEDANWHSTIAVLRGFDRARRVELARRLGALAAADPQLSRRRTRLLVRVLDILDVTEADLDQG